MELKTSLIQEAEMKKTGANTHSVNKAIHKYETNVDIANGTAWWIQNESEDDKKLLQDVAEENAKDWERVLQTFVASGVIP